MTFATGCQGRGAYTVDRDRVARLVEHLADGDVDHARHGAEAFDELPGRCEIPRLIAPDETDLEVRRCPGGERLTITVDDDGAGAGAGIPEPETERVFLPFVHLESSRSRETGGVGLGLSIARTIVHAHGGEVRLINRAG